MDSAQLTSGHGPAGGRRLAFERAKRALAAGNADEFAAACVLLFEPYHDDERAIRLLEAGAAQFESDARPLYWLAKIAVHRRLDDTAARRYLEEALAREPENPESLALLGSLRLRIGEVRASEELANRLVTLVPDWPSGHILRGQVLQAEGRVGEAEAEYRTAREAIDAATRGAVPDTYFERVVTCRRAEPVTKDWLDERIATLKSRDE